MGEGVFFVKKRKMGMFFVKKWTSPQSSVHYVQYQYFLFYVLLIWGVRTAPNAPPSLRALLTSALRLCPHRIFWTGEL